MDKKSILCAFILAAFAAAFALEGTLDTTNNRWGPGGNVASPVQIQGPVTVPAGLTLFIYPGTVVQGASGIYVAGGRLDAVGTNDQRIDFRQDVNLRHSPEARLQYCNFNRTFLNGESSSVSAFRCNFTGPEGGISLDSCTFTLNACLIADLSQSGITLVNSKGSIWAATSFNVSNIHVSVSGTTDVAVVNCIFSGGAYGIWALDAASRVNVSYSLFNTLFPVYSTASVVTRGAGIIENLDPLFTDTAGNVFTLRPFSPAKDAGDPGWGYAEEPVPNGCRVDMGCYGNRPEATPSRIEITRPNGGETFQGGSQETITWNSARFSGGKVLEYSSDNGANWNAVATMTADSGSYSWTVPQLAALSSLCLVRISCTGCSALSDASDAVFTLQPGPAVEKGLFTPCRMSLDCAPHPVRSVSSVGFSIPFDANVALTLVDLSGRIAGTLAKGAYPAGYHRAAAPGLGLPAGVYVLRLTAGNHKLEKRLVILK